MVLNFTRKNEPGYWPVAQASIKWQLSNNLEFKFLYFNYEIPCRHKHMKYSINSINYYMMIKNIIKLSEVSLVYN